MKIRIGRRSTELLRRTAALGAALLLLTAAAGCRKTEPPSPGVSAAPEATTTAKKEESAVTESAALKLPESSKTLAWDTAQQLLTLCTGHTAERQRLLLENAGFEVLLQDRYDKAPDDTSHTCAYTVARQTVTHRGEARTLLAVMVRGTDAAEWYSNMDVAPSRREDTEYAENFLETAQDVQRGLQPLLEAETEPLVAVAGHSRGAACANLLGTLLNASLGTERVYVYTFATPATFRGREIGVDCGNIFNFINPCDPVTKLPLEGWGYYRPGRDILLPGDADTAQRVEAGIQTLWAVSPTLSAYYNDRHSLTGAGLSEDGMTAYELMRSAAGLLADPEAGGLTLPAGGVSDASDLAPMLSLLQSLAGGDGTGLGQVASQHLPSTYRTLMTAAAAR